MPALAPPQKTPEIVFDDSALSGRSLTTHDLCLIVAHAKDQKSLLKQCQRSPELLKQYARSGVKSPNAALRLAADEKRAGILLIFVKSGLSTFEKLQSAAKLYKEASSYHASKVALSTLGFDAQESQAWLNALLAAVLAGDAPLPSYKQKPSISSLNAISVMQGGAAETYAETLATHAGNHLARWLTTLPPNELNCSSYRDALLQLAKRHKWRAKFLDLKALKQHQAGAFLAVSRANEHRDAGILQLSYRAAKTKTGAAKRKLSLVGKGICFDTGGINLKPHRSMYDMHTDMQGSAVAVGTLLALTQLNVPFDVDCWLALTENEIGPNAYRPQEVVKAMNGTTIQVVHSDAEGRMVMADTLTLAAKAAPNVMIDFATLTGACVGALTERMSGAFSNRNELRESIEAAGRSSGERVWSFPMDSDYDSDLDSPIADIMQCTLDSKGDHILAARFLNHFVPASVPWIHIDLSSSSKTGGLAHVPSDITGFGVRWAVEFVTHHFFK